jgi:hypothetical protein
VCALYFPSDERSNLIDNIPLLHLSRHHIAFFNTSIRECHQCAAGVHTLFSFPSEECLILIDNTPLLHLSRHHIAFFNTSNRECRQCAAGVHTCAHCGDVGQAASSADYYERDGMRKCRVTGCHRFYHDRCAKMLKRTTFFAAKGTTALSYRCAAHYCNECEKPGEFKRLSLVSIISCLCFPSVPASSIHYTCRAFATRHSRFIPFCFI